MIEALYRDADQLDRGSKKAADFILLVQAQERLSNALSQGIILVIGWRLVMSLNFIGAHPYSLGLTFSIGSK